MPKTNKANKELLEKLKEEMRKIRRPQVSQTNLAQTSTECVTEKPSTLLTIPALVLGENSNFMLRSCSYLKTREKDNAKIENDGKIPMSVVESNEETPKKESGKKRKYSLNQENTESEEEEGEARSDDEEEEQSDESQSD